MSKENIEPVNTFKVGNAIVYKKKPYFFYHFWASVGIIAFCFGLCFLKITAYADVSSTIKDVIKFFGIVQGGVGIAAKIRDAIKG